MNNFADLKLAVEAISGGKNTVVFDDLGYPSIMVVIPKMLTKDLIADVVEATPHPAFVVGDKTLESVMLSKYLNVVVGDRAYSLPGKDPRANITWEAAQAACRKKGNGWGLTPFSLWSAIALWCKKNGTMPHGNNQYGADIGHPHERGVVTYTYMDTSVQRNGRTATGSGPATWYHDHTPFGIADMNGNIWDWCAGMRLVKGEIQIIPNADCMKSDCDMSAESEAWKAILVSGSLATPKTAGTLKYDWVGSKVTLATEVTGEAGTEAPSGQGSLFEQMGKSEAVTAVPQLIKELALYPADENGYEGDWFYINNVANERFPVRGGRWHDGAAAGVFCTHLSGPRAHSHRDVGFRSAYYGEL